MDFRSIPTWRWVKRPLNILLLPASISVCASSAFAQNVTPGLSGPWSVISRAQTRRIDNNDVSTLRVRYCVGSYQLTAATRISPAPKTTGTTDNGDGSAGSTISGTTTCADSVTGPSSPRATVQAAPPINASVNGNLRAASADTMTLELTDAGGTMSYPAVRISGGGLLVRDYGCPSKGFVVINRGFGPRSECQFVLVMQPAIAGRAPTESPDIAQSLSEALRDADSAAVLRIQFARTLDTLLLPQAHAVGERAMNYFDLLAPITVDSTALTVRDIVRRLASDGSDIFRIMRTGYRWGAETQASEAKRATEYRATINAAATAPVTGRAKATRQHR